MRIYQNTIWNKRFPTYLGLIVLGLSLVTITWLTGNTVFFGSKAAAGGTPKNIQISNISDSAFTVSYTTDDSVIGTVSFGKDLPAPYQNGAGPAGKQGPKLGSVGLDDRDQKTGSPAPHRVHHITLIRLEASSKYSFSIVSGNAIFLNNNAPYQVTTAPPSKENPAKIEPVAGQVALDSGGLPSEGIAYISSSQSQLLSTLFKPDGSYLLPLNTIRKKDLSAPLLLSHDSVLQMHVVTSTMESTITILASQGNPVPLILLSKNYNFTASNEPVPKEASPSAQVPVFPTTEESPASSSSVPQILSPQQQEKFKDQQPMFKGKALPNSEVEVTIQSQKEIKTVVQADANGNWQFRPSVPLDPGQHTLTIKTVDISGALTTLTRPFTVYAQGGRFTEPSVSPTSVPTQTTSPTPTSTQPTVTQPSPSVISPTISTTISPTTSISSPPVTSTSGIPVIVTQPPQLKPGSSSFLFGLFAAGLSIGIGAILFFLTRGGTSL